MVEHFQLRLVDSFMLAPSFRHMVFERADGKALPFKAGQFVQLHMNYPDGKPTRRSFSVATVVPEDATEIRRIEFAVSYVEGGLATNLLGNMAHGGEVEASGPFGRFYLFDDDANERYLLVATGTGIAPYRSMLAAIEKRLRERGCRFVLLFGARNETELLYGEEFAAFAREHDGFTFHPCFSRGARPDPRPHDRLGHVQDMLPELEPTPDKDIAYLCGNPEMVDQTFAALKEAGLSIRYIRREKYVSSR
jgi:ferredoxin-NADP reductase